jgi:hypothetical protein
MPLTICHHTEEWRRGRAVSESVPMDAILVGQVRMSRGRLTMVRDRVIAR